MRIASILENQLVEKRIEEKKISTELAKRVITLVYEGAMPVEIACDRLKRI